MKWLALLLLCTGCAAKIETEDSNHTISGEAYTYVVVRVEAIAEIRQLCQDKYNQVVDQGEFKRLVAECTFENLSILNLDTEAIRDVTQDICAQDPLTLTPDALTVYNALCL